MGLKIMTHFQKNMTQKNTSERYVSVKMKIMWER